MAGNSNSGGANRLPKHIKEMRGTLEKGRDNPNAPSPKASLVGPPPTQFDSMQRAVWAECAECVDVLGTYSAADAIAFRMLVENVAITRSAGVSDGARARAYTTATNLMSRFGMDPASRNRVSRNPDAHLDTRDTNDSESSDAVPLFGAGLKVVGD